MHTDVKNFTSNNLRPKKKARLLKGKARFNHEIPSGPAEMHSVQPFGPSIVRNMTNPNDISRYEDEIFSAFIVSQLRHIPHHKKLLLKMQISNLIYNEMLASLSAWEHPSTNNMLPQPSVPHTTAATSGVQAQDTADFPNEIHSPQETHSEEPLQTTAVIPNSTELQQATVTLPKTAQPLQAVTLPISDTSNYTPQLSQVTVTLPQTVRPIHATVSPEPPHRISVNPTWSRLQLQQQRQRECSAGNP
ncbi:uncharacterized protein LOC110238615 [Exaiptasia diaphana]|uniref:BESS domain-containing protein n=1 Tax=Exaiptasia diaphana TaxID=2652724 RepID=A0A913X899_EXADI|nr:uncharacterized protein LOC110238615 [Exaiptasia diaphana]